MKIVKQKDQSFPFALVDSEGTKLFYFDRGFSEIVDETFQSVSKTHAQKILSHPVVKNSKEFMTRAVG